MKHIFLITTICSLFFWNKSIAQNSSDSTKSILEKGAHELKMKMARQKFYAEDFRGALNAYRELYSLNEKDPIINVRMGETYLALNELIKSIEHLEKAKSINPLADKELTFVLGRAYHKFGKFDAAIAEFENYKSITKEKKEEFKEANRYISQCNTAKRLIANPVKVEIMNLGANVNSPYDDYAPSITASGKTMIFTSRRTGTTGEMLDANDGKYYEDIYIVNWDSEKKDWGIATQIPGKLNTEFHDANLSISPDGSQIFVYKNVPNETRSGDIYVSKQNASGNWASPKPLPQTINSSYFESSASLSADGNYLYFVSERKGGFGQADIYRSAKNSATEWGEAENLGANINSSEDELSVFIHPDGKTLYFSSAGPNSMGGLDIFKSVYENGQWGTPENLGYPINTLGDDLHFVISADNKKAYYSSIRPGGMGERDIFSINMDLLNNTMKKDEKGEKGMSIIKGNVKLLKSGNPIEAEIEFFEFNSSERFASTNSDAEGHYFIALEGGKDYEVSIKVKGCKSIREKLTLPVDEDGTFILYKHFLVEKQEE